jgi:4-hydroxy-tetrahydrodipicolinate reductase
MHIGLFGYGKMGRAIEAAALARRHTIAWRVQQGNRDLLTPERLREADLVIEFSQPEAAFENVMLCLEAGLPVVSGTTGWLEQVAQAQQWCRAHDGAFLWASNFSVGVNLLFAVNRYLARLMDQRPEYAPSITETHHIHKLDAPSGTAISLALDLVNELERKNGWKLYPAPAAEDELPIVAVREGEVPGTHVVRWSSPIDELVLEHRAHNRSGFAAGAVLAAEWLLDKKGAYSMQDVLGL